MAQPDPHSYFDDTQARTARWHLALNVDFSKKEVSGAVTLHFVAPAQGPLDLDTRGLSIEGVSTAGGQTVPWELLAEQPILGARLRLTLPEATGAVTVRYRASPESSALQWLAPAQTHGGKHPFLFSQCQAIHARALVPCQDSAIARVSYTAAVTVPAGLSVVMSAGPKGEVANADGSRTFHFEMPQTIPPYLLALAVGELASQELGPRSRVYAEPGMLAKAAWEFAEVEAIIQKAEGVFGPYDWERFDLLVLPPSFPYGGMENPRMTFLTPTLLAGDRSLVDVVAHELAHSWTGNLITNATSEHFWLNEGWTVWAERRILEAMHGKEAALVSWSLGQTALDDALRRFEKTPQLTCLRTHLTGVDPDDAFSSIPYEKGSRFIHALELAVGRERFDAFARQYMQAFRFGVITTEAFCAFVEQQLPGVLAQVKADQWLHQPGMPAGAPTFRSPTLDAIEAVATGWKVGVRPTPEQRRTWTPTELLLYLQRLPRPLPERDCAWLDEQLALTSRGNAEVLFEWLAIAAASEYAPAFPRMREMLRQVGRLKYLRPVYAQLGTTVRTRALGREIFAQAKDGYHGLTRRMIQGVIDHYET